MPNADEYISLGEAAKLAPGRPSACAVWRWCRKGIKSRSGQRIKLNHVRAGGKIFTTKAALDTFSQAVTEADQEHFDQVPNTLPVVPTRTDPQRQKDIEPAEKELAAESALEVVSRKNRAAFEQMEQRFQQLEDWPGLKPQPMDPLRVLEAD